MAGKTHHVVHSPSGGWNVRRGGAKRASGHYTTKHEAITAGRKMSRNQRTEFLIHGLNGKIQSSDSHGHDPHPPKG